jgi:hypothetical protein
MKSGLIFTLIYIITNLSLYSQNQNLEFGFYSGAILGGPIPQKTLENSQGKPLVAPFAGFSIKKDLKNNFYFQADLAYAMKGASYSQEYSKDTLIDIGIGVVPSFYTAKIGGHMKLHYLDLPISLGYNISEKHSLSLGFYTSFLFAGYDKTNIFIQAGYGDFADFEQKVNNFSSINKQDFGITMKYTRHLFCDLYGVFTFSRSTRSLYTNTSDNNLLHTNLSMAISYVLR